MVPIVVFGVAGPYYHTAHVVVVVEMMDAEVEDAVSFVAEIAAAAVVAAC